MMDARMAAVSPVPLLLVVIAACSSGTRTRSCTIEPIRRSRCDAPIDLSQLTARATTLLGTRVTLVGPLGKTHPWCTDCCPPVGAVLALVEPSPAPRMSVTMAEWKCTQSQDRERADRADCPIPADGRTVVVRGRLERVLHSENDFVLHDSELCDP